jgi:LAO/AO transport system kinase
VTDLKNMLALGMGPSSPRGGPWEVPVVPTSAARDEGISGLADAIDRHRAFLQDSGEIDNRRRQINERRLLRAGVDILRARFAQQPEERVRQLFDELQARTLSPHRVAEQLLQDLRKENGP